MLSLRFIIDVYMYMVILFFPYINIRENIKIIKKPTFISSAIKCIKMSEKHLPSQIASEWSPFVNKWLQYISDI